MNTAVIRVQNFITACSILYCMTCSIQAQPAMLRAVIGSGGGSALNGDFSLNAAFGQPLAGKAGNDSNELQAGFWYGIDTVVGINEEKALPIIFDVEMNFPNPFSRETTIRYSLPEESSVLIAIYDIHGRQVERFLTEIQELGYYDAKISAFPYTPGVYFCRITAGGKSLTIPMVVVR